MKRQVYEALFHDIIGGSYPPEHLFTEKFLMEKYGVSRAPIREALAELVGQQVLQSVPRQGYRILLPDSAALADITRTRAVLEPAFLLQYGHQLLPEQLAPLRELCRQSGALDRGQTLERWRLNCLFHRTLFSFYGNRFAASLLEKAMDTQTIFFVLKAREADYGEGLHVAVLDYLERGDLEMAARLLRTDIGMLSPGKEGE